MPRKKAFQDHLPEFDCFGCGPANRHGLRIKSFWDPEDEGVAVCQWKPRSHHSAGFPNVTNGGIITTAIDSHCIWTATATAYRAEDRVLASDPLIVFVTKAIQVEFLKPTPMDRSMILRARVVYPETEKFEFTDEREWVVNCSVYVDGIKCAKGEVVVWRKKRKPSST